MLLFTQPTAYIDYLKQIFDPVDCTSSIDPLNGCAGTLKYADYWHNRLWALKKKNYSRYRSHGGMIRLSKAFLKQPHKYSKLCDSYTCRGRRLWNSRSGSFFWMLLGASCLSLWIQNMSLLCWVFPNATKSFSSVFPLLKQSLTQPGCLKLYEDEGSLELLTLPLLPPKY